MRSSSAVVTLASGCVLFVACGLFDDSSPALKTNDDIPNDFRVIGTSSERLVAGNGDGLVYTSKDGEKWIINLLLQDNAPRAVFADDQIVIAIGDKTFARSLAGTDTFIQLFTNHAAPLAAIGACLNAHYVVGGAGYVKRSTDGTTWLGVDGISSSADLVGVACGPSSVLVGSAKQSSGHWLSTDGTKFTNTTSPADTCAVGYANGVFLDVATDGHVFTSPDAKTWTKVEAPLWLATVTSCKLVSDADTIVVAADGQVWTSPPELGFVPWPTPDGPVKDVALPPTGGKLRAVGPGGYLLTAQCTNGTCAPPVVTVPKVQNPGTSAPPSDNTSSSSSSSSSSSGSSGGCGGCMTDDDCTGVAQRHGAPGAACNPSDHLCYACATSCVAGGSNCVCIKCSEGCGGGTMCYPGGTLCTAGIDGALPCQ